MKQLVFVIFMLFTISCKSQEKVDYTKYVNPFIGSEGTGHTFPGPCMPFGMVQPGPDNVDKGWDYTSGYQYKDSIILGFSQTRANGTGINEFGQLVQTGYYDMDIMYLIDTLKSSGFMVFTFPRII